MKEKLLLGFLSLLLMGCSRDSEEGNFVPSAASSGRSWVRTPDEALETLAAILENDGDTRSVSLDITSLETVKVDDVNAVTRSQTVPDTGALFYVVSFGERSGSAILGADKRLPSVLAILDETVVSSADFIESSTRADGADSEILHDFILPRLIASSISLMAVNPTDPDLPDPGPGNPGPWTPKEPRPRKELLVSCDKRQKPLLKTRWDQEKPYNNYCGGCPAGCTAIAVAQLLTYWSLPDPNVIGEVSFDWNLIRQNCYGRYPSVLAEDEVARYVQTLGVCLHTTYTPTGSSSTIADAEGVLRALAFPNVERGGYDVGTAERMVFAGRPVYVRGTDRYSSDGHAWILDGWYRYEAKMCTWIGNQMVSAEPIQDVLAHCNFGWGGKGDGYYYPLVFNTELRQEKDEASGDQDARKNVDFDSGLKMLVY